MSRKWKQQTAMFVFVMIAMTRTISAMKSPSEGKEFKMNPADGQNDDDAVVFFSDQEIEDGLEKAQNQQPKKEKSRWSERMPVENTPVKVKKVKNAKHFAHFLEGEDLLKYTLLHTRHKNFIERIPVTCPIMLSDGTHESGIVFWNMNAETVERARLRPEIMNFQTETLKFVKDVFSRIPDTESPTDYDFSFDTTGDYKNWFMLAVHKRKKTFIGRQWKWIARHIFETSNFEPCDVQNRWIENAPDVICKSLLENGFHFPRKWTYQKICENDIQCALTEKLDKSLKFLLLSHSDAKETGLNFRCDDLCSTNDPESLESKNFAVNDEIENRYTFNNEDIKKAFRYNLCESFTFMMKSKNWPEKLWRHVLESEHEQSKEMIKLLFERIKASPNENQLDILLKTNANGKIGFFDKVMHLAGHESTSGHLNDCLKIFRKSVQTRVYQQLLFFGVVKHDLPQCKFAVKNGASLQEKTSSRAAIEITNKYGWCEKKMCPQEDLENDTIANDRHKCCLYLNLKDKTALEIATNLARSGLEGGDHNGFKNIKIYLENEKNKDESNMEDLPISLDTESEDDELDDFKKRKRKIRK